MWLLEFIRKPKDTEFPCSHHPRKDHRVKKKKITWSFLWRFDHFYKCSGEKIHFCVSIPRFSIDWASDNSTSRIFSCLHPVCNSFRDQRALSVPAVTTKLKSITKQTDTQPGRARGRLISVCPYLTWSGLMLCFRLTYLLQTYPESGSCYPFQFCA